MQVMKSNLFYDICFNYGVYALLLYFLMFFCFSCFMIFLVFVNIFPLEPLQLPIKVFFLVCEITSLI